MWWLTLLAKQTAQTDTHTHKFSKKVKFSGYPGGGVVLWGAWLGARRTLYPSPVFCYVLCKCAHPTHLLCAFARKFTPYRLIFPHNFPFFSLTSGSSSSHFNFLGVRFFVLFFLR